jgi:hypothetical protein
MIFSVQLRTFQLYRMLAAIQLKNLLSAWDHLVLVALNPHIQRPNSVCPSYMFLLLYLLPILLSAASFLYICYLTCWLLQDLSVRDLFMKQLIQLHGLSVQKAQAIVERYHTPRALMAAYQAEGSAGEKLLASIHYGSLNRLIGPVISRTIHQFYTKPLLS